MNTTTGILFTFLFVFLGLGTALGQKLKVPNDLIGIWQGISGSKNGITWNITLGILEGSGKDAIGFLERRDIDGSCTYILDHSSEKKDKDESEKNMLQAKTRHVKDDCRTGELEFDFTIPNRLIVDAKWSGNNPDDWSFAMERMDDGSLGKALGKC